MVGAKYRIFENIYDNINHTILKLFIKTNSYWENSTGLSNITLEVQSFFSILQYRLVVGNSFKSILVVRKKRVKYAMKSVIFSWLHGFAIYNLFMHH